MHFQIFLCQLFGLLVAYLYLFSSIFVRLFIFSWKSNLFVSIFSQCIVNVNDHLRHSQRMCVEAFGILLQGALDALNILFFFLILLCGYNIAHFSKYQRKRRSHNKKILEPYIHAVCMLKGKETDAAERHRRTKAKKSTNENMRNSEKRMLTKLSITALPVPAPDESEWIGASSTLYAVCTSHMAIQIVSWCNNEKSPIFFWPSFRWRYRS